MRPADTIITELHDVYSEDAQESNPLTLDLLYKWERLLGGGRTGVYDFVAIYLAKGFNNGSLSFDFCDEIANDLFSRVIDIEDDVPSRFWEVYLAFDEGENPHSDNPQADPVEIYTRPLIAKFLEKLPPGQ